MNFEEVKKILATSSQDEWIVDDESGSFTCKNDLNCKNWANVPNGKYLNVVRIENLGEGPAGNATDFPIFSDLPDEQILEAFVSPVATITGCRLENS